MVKVDGIEEAFDSRNLFQVRLGYVKVPRIEEPFDSRNLLPSTALDLSIFFILKVLKIFNNVIIQLCSNGKRIAKIPSTLTL